MWNSEAMNERVGIVVPFFDTDPDFLRASVDSVLAQSIPVQLVLVDDGSTDPRTIDLSREYERSAPVRVIRHEQNRGVAAALNSGISQLTTEYVFAVASDDIVEPTYAQRAAEILDARPEVAIVTTQISRFGATSGVDAPGGAPNGLVDLLFYNVIPGISVCRREAWEAVGGYSDLTFAEDYDFWLRVLDRGGICVSIDEPLYRYRIHPGQATSTTTWEDKLHQQLTIVRRNPDIWARHIDVVMESYWRQQVELNYYKKRYGKINAVKKGAIDRMLGLRARARGLVTSKAPPS